MEILVLNLTRMGDIIQSSILVKNLKKYFPDSQISYLLLDNFKDTAFLIEGIDNVIPIDFSNVLKEIDFLNIRESLKNLKALLHNVMIKEFDLVINLSFSKLSAYINFLINGKKKNGLLFSKTNEFIATDKWSRYFLSIVDNREFSPFNLVDIYTKVGLENRKIFTEKKEKVVLNRNNLNFGFVLGASTYDRRWPAFNFASLAKKILAFYKNSTIYLFGTKSEEKLAKQFFEHLEPNQRIINLVGKTSLKQLEEVISKKVSVLITNDTGTMHLGWFRGKTVIELSLGPALYNTTGPYGEGHIVIQPDIDCAPCSYLTKCSDLKCHFLITSEIVFNCVQYLTGYVGKLIDSKEVKILESFIDREGFVGYKLLSGLKTDDLRLKTKLKSVWLKTFENNLKKNGKYFIKENSKYALVLLEIKSLIKILSLSLKTAAIEEKVKLILELENKIKRIIYSDYKELLPFLKYLEYSRNLLSETALLQNLQKLKNLYETFYFQIRYIEGGEHEGIY